MRFPPPVYQVLSAVKAEGLLTPVKLSPGALKKLGDQLPVFPGGIGSDIPLLLARFLRAMTICGFLEEQYEFGGWSSYQLSPLGEEVLEEEEVWQRLAAKGGSDPQTPPPVIGAHTEVSGGVYPYNAGETVRTPPKQLPLL